MPPPPPTPPPAPNPPVAQPPSTTNRIHCIADAEPASFLLQGSDGAVAYSLNLSCEVAADPPYSDDQKKAAQKFFTDFLKAAASTAGPFKFLLVSSSMNPSLPNPAWTTMPLTPDQVLSASPFETPEPLVGWLNDGERFRVGKAGEGLDDPDKVAKAAAEAATAYWFVRPAIADSAGTGTGVGEDDIGAAHELRSAHAWNAPVAHRFGLTRVVRKIAPPADSDFHYILPYLGDNPPIPSSAPPKDPDAKAAIVEFSYNCGGDLGDIVCQASRLFLPDSQGLALVTSEGFLQVNKGDDQFRRLLNAFEEQATTLVSPAIALARISAWAVGLRPDPKTVAGLNAGIWDLFKPTWTRSAKADGWRPDPTDPEHKRVQNGNNPAWIGVADNSSNAWIASAPNAAWLAVTALCVALDPIIIALLRPASASADPVARPEGQILSVLVSAILEALGDGRKPAASEIAEGIRIFLSGSAICDKVKWQNKQALVDALRHVHDLKPTADISSGPETLIEVLLKLFLADPPASDSKMPTPVQFGAVVALAANDGDREQAGFGTNIMAASSTSGTRLHDEGEFEKAILRFFETATKDFKPFAADYAEAVAEGIAARIAEAARIPFTEKPDDPLMVAVKKAWHGFGAELADAFNGAEAARRSADADFIVALLVSSDTTPQSDESKAAACRRSILAGTSYAGRLFGPASGCFAQILDALPRPDAPIGLQNRNDVMECLASAHVEALVALDNLAAPQRFIPDAVPHPLTVQIAETVSPEKAEAFAHRFNGVAVAMRRLDKPDSPFAHLNLAELSWPRPPNAQGQPDVTLVSAALHPIMPSVTDGRGPLFVNYEGFPFASTAFHDTIPFADNPPVARQPFYKYDVAAITDENGSPGPAKAYAPAPQPAYGRTFETVGFVLSNSGAMAKSMRKSDDEPWLPAAEINVDDDAFKAAKAQVDYQRRTAIGRVGVRNAKSNSAARIGVSISGVQPLANDYPRLALLANGAASPGAVDLVRHIDGSGGLELAQEVGKTNAKVELVDLDWIGGPGKLKVLVFGKPTDLSQDPSQPSQDNAVGLVVTETIGTTAEPCPRKLTIALTAAPYGLWQISVIADENQEAFAATPFDPPVSNNQFFWLRLVLSAENDVPVSLSFSEPEFPLGAGHGVRDAPLLLLSQANKRVWAKDFSIANAVVGVPRTGFLDFERWFANEDRKKDLIDKLVDDATVKNFLHTLLSAYVVRNADQRLADGLANLLDPSVAKLRFRLIPADRLGELVLQNKLQRIVDLSPALPGTLHDSAQDQSKPWEELAKKVKAVKDAETAHDMKGAREKTSEWIGDLISLFGLCDEAGRPPKGIFERWNLDRLFTFDLVFQTGPVLKIDPVDDKTTNATTVFVPPGVVAHLEIAPLVERKHFDKLSSDGMTFPAVFDSGMLQYAVGPDGDFVVFPATIVRIETMTDTITVGYLKEAGQGITPFIKSMVAASPAGASRRYDLVTAKDVETIAGDDRQRALRSAWRINAEIDTTTQRWRPMGRPIHAFPDPGLLPDKLDLDRFAIDGKVVNDPATPSLQVARSTKADVPDLARFERELYFDRPEIDSQTVTQRLTPLPAPTNLHTVVWEAPSATYLRHRFTLRSRYDDALVSRTDTPTWTKPDGATKTAPEGADARTKYEEWTLRVAMLADMSRLTVTRPQVRGFLPLTTARATDDYATSSPPILAILQEPPFGRGGLAERIGAELGLGFGYRFDTKDSTDPIHIFDSRKEIGRDPRLTYRPFDSAKAFGMTLRVEGPLGLTFDDANAPSPAFPNSLALLTPDSVTADAPLNLEEHFLGVSLRRWLDPDWMVSPGAAAVGAAPPRNQPGNAGAADPAPGQGQQPANAGEPPPGPQSPQPRGDSPPPGLDPDICWWVELPNAAIDGVGLGDYDQHGNFVSGEYTIGLVSANDLGALQTAPDDRTADALVMRWLTIGGEIPEGSRTLDSDIREIRIAKVVIDPVPVNDQVVVGRFAKNNVENLYLLHQPVAAGRYTTSVLAATKFPATSTNASGPAPPVVLATFEWSPRRFLDTNQPPAPIVGSRLVSRAVPPLGGKLAPWTARRAMASAPTPLAWTRIGRDHSRWLRYNDDECEPVSASALRPTVTQSTLDFGSPWLCSSTFADQRTPVHVHRRLAVIATRYASGGGRPVELYSGAALLDGRTATFAQLKDGAADLCRLVEFETPAMVLTNWDEHTVPATYKSAYFDFRTSLGDQDPTLRTIEFYLRFVGRTEHLKKFVNLSVFVRAPGKGDDPNTPLSLAKLIAPSTTLNGKYPVGMRLQFSQGKFQQATFQTSDGASIKATDTPILPGSPAPPFVPASTDDASRTDGRIVQIKAQSTGNEFWTDVSLLHSKQSNGANMSDFDYDWLFSATADDSLEPAQAVRAIALTQTVEPQARIIAMSPAIPIQRKP